MRLNAETKKLLLETADAEEAVNGKEGHKLAEVIRMLVDHYARDNRPAPVWRHAKRGTSYTVVGEARLQSSEPVHEGVPLVVYRCRVTGDLWARPTGEFYDGRYELA